MLMDSRIHWVEQPLRTRENKSFSNEWKETGADERERECESEIYIYFFYVLFYFIVILNVPFEPFWVLSPCVKGKFSFLCFVYWWIIKIYLFIIYLYQFDWPVWNRYSVQVNSEVMITCQLILGSPSDGWEHWSCVRDTDRKRISCFSETF